MKQNKKQKTIFYISLIIAFGGVSIIVALATQVGGEYVTELVRGEQEDHYQKLQEQVLVLSATYDDLQVYLDALQERRLTPAEKKEATVLLNHLEEIGLNISRRTLFYYEDNTAHFFFAPRAEILRYFDEARNTPLYIDRCVRFAEAGLTIPNPSQTQKQSLRENCDALAQEVERLQN